MSEQFIGGEEPLRQDVFPWKTRLARAAAGAGRGQASGGGSCVGRDCLHSVRRPEAMKEEDAISGL